MRATGKDIAKAVEGTGQERSKRQRGDAAKVIALPRPLEPVSVHARVRLAMERVGKLGRDLDHIQTELRRYETVWITLPLEEVPAGVERLKWLKEHTEPLVGLVIRAWDKRYAGLPGSRTSTARARMRLLESLYEVVVQRDAWLVRAAFARKALGRPRPDDYALLERVDLEALRRGEAAAADDSKWGDWAPFADWPPPSPEHTASAARSLFSRLGRSRFVGASRPGSRPHPSHITSGAFR